MTLTLTAVPFDGDPLFSGSATVTGERYTIGRAADNDWVLADAKRLVSKNHCLIERVGEGFRVVDRSTNGVRINDRTLSRGDAARLSTGDEIGVGGYTFRVAVSRPAAGLPHVEGHVGLGPLGGGASVSSVLEDVSQGENGARAMPDALPDARPDAFGERVTPGRGGALGTIGWDGPPDPEIDVAAARAEAPPAATAFSDRSQQVGPDRQLIDLPRAAPAPVENGNGDGGLEGQAKPATIIPDDWLDAVADIVPPERRPPPADPRARVIPVENLDLSVEGDARSRVKEVRPVPATPPVPSAQPASPSPALAPAPAAPDRTREMIEALCDGMGVDPALLRDAAEEPGDAVRLMHNVGLALRHASEALLAQTQSRARAGADAAVAPERTPWVFAMAGSDRSRLMDSVAVFLGEAEPRDLGALRADHEAITRFVDALPASVVAFVDRFEGAMDAQGSGGFMGLGRADRWDAFSRALALPQERGAVRGHLLGLLGVQGERS